MKLSHVLASLNQIEKSKFINCLDKICSESASSGEVLSKAFGSSRVKIKDASGSEITQLFDKVRTEYKNFLKEQLALAEPSTLLLVNILTRDGNGVSHISWIENLYTKEWEVLDVTSKEISLVIRNNQDVNYSREHRLRIFSDCMEIAYTNDRKSNRECKITDDERSILNALASHLKIPKDEVVSVEHIFDPVLCGRETVEAGLQQLREIGVVLINRKTLEVLIADEMVEILNEIQGKLLPDKYFLRILRYLTDGELSRVLKSYNKKIRGVSRVDRIKNILHSGISIYDVLSLDMFDETDNQNQKKSRLKDLIENLGIDTLKMGSTVEDRINIILNGLKSSTDREFNELSVSGYKDLYEALSVNFPSSRDSIDEDETLESRMRQEFELEDSEPVNIERLRALSITPHDILYMLSNAEVKSVCDKMSISKRGNQRRNLVEAFVSANDKLIENYAALARRDLLSLKDAGVDISESEIGSKFEEVTKSIMESLNLNVDEDLRRSINTSKDKADIILSISEDDVIICEAKTCKSGDFAKYSTTARQVKSYVSRCEHQGHRVAQVLIIAPSFSKDFIESSEMDTDINISLLTASGLKDIYDSYTNKKRPRFSPNLFTKGGLLKADLIAKNI